MRTWIASSSLALLLGLSVSRPAAAADAASSRKADESFQQGHVLLEDKRYTDACPKFEESQRQDPASGTLLALAYCEELSGLLATSWGNYLSAARLADREGQRERQTAATERARSLLDRVSKLTVVVPAELLNLPGFHLVRDGIEFERASFGVAVPNDGGSHAFLASAPGRVSWSSTVTLLAERDEKTLVLPVLDRVATAPPFEVPSDSGVVASQSRRSLSAASLSLFAGSVVGIGLGTAFALRASSKNNQSYANGCDGRSCNEVGAELRQDSLAAARVSTWSFVAAGAFAAGGLTLYLTSPVRSTNAASGVASPALPTRLVGNASLGAPGVALIGSF